MRNMYDAVTPANIPANPQMVAGYVNGHYAWTTADWAKFPHAAHVTIDVNGARPDADVLDVENGDATPAGAVQWVKAKLARKGSYLPILYCNRSTLTPLFNALQSAGYTVNEHFRTWVAVPGGDVTLKDMTGVTAIQWKFAGGYDESTVYDNSFKVAAPPKPPTPPVVSKPTPAPVLKGVLVAVPSGIAKTVTSADNGITWK